MNRKRLNHQLSDHQLFRLLPLPLPFCCGFVAGLTSIPTRIYRCVADVAAQEGGRGEGGKGGSRSVILGRSLLATV